MCPSQLILPLDLTTQASAYRAALLNLLQGDLDFHDRDSGYATHNFHAFPAKFPPQLPRLFIDALTQPGDLVLDPMAGSGTTLLEAYLSGRSAIGFDIDPLALWISRVKSQALYPEVIRKFSQAILTGAKQELDERMPDLKRRLDARWDDDTRHFVDYWFMSKTQLELFALLTQIEKISDLAVRNFFEMALSAIIITKSGGVSLALDLAHTRPHRAKLIYSKNGDVIEGQKYVDNPTPHARYRTKILRSPLVEFEKRVQNNLKGLSVPDRDTLPAQVVFGNAQSLPLSNNSVDLIVTSPPYASNAIDYVRAHKFSLVWLGYSINQLSLSRNEYIGSEGISQFDFGALPPDTAGIVTDIANIDQKKGQVLHRYYTEMTRSLAEMYRVLKPGKAAVVVVGSSTLRGKDTHTHYCLSEIGRSIGFDVPLVGVRDLDRNRRMLPAGAKTNLDSQIQQRMHEEYVIGFYKP